LTFNEFSLKENLLRAVEAMGYEIPTPIQEKVIPQILSDNRDLIGLAETGSGKTAAFGLPMLHKIDEDLRETQGLILAPTRELCMQIAREMEKYSRFQKGVILTSVYGGAPFPPQIKALRQGSHIIIATPGRLLDLIKKGVARLDKLKFLVLDEADVMLNMGFKDDLDAILEAAPGERQSLLLSATMPPEVSRIAKNYMTEPLEITAGVKNKGTANVDHSCYMVHARDKYKALKRLVDSHPGIYGIIFCRTRLGCQDIANKMIKEGYNTDALHGDLSQNQREYVMKKFREGSLQLLVATDIAARGLDVDSLSHVIHYDLPDEMEVYNHRSGRTGRAGNKGNSFAIIHMKEKYRIRKIENILGRKIEYREVPTGRMICEAQLMAMIDKVKSVNVDDEEIGPYMSVIEEKLEGVDRETLIHKFVSLEFNHFLEYYGKEQDLNTPVNDRSSSWGNNRGRDRDGRSRDYNRNSNSRDSNNSNRSKNTANRDRRPGETVNHDRKPRNLGNSGKSDGMTAISISVGKRDNILPPQVIGLINDNTQGQKIPLGKITIGPASSIVYVDSGSVDSISKGLKRVSFRGRRLKIKVLPR
jgi:ATP-dependent RNA helicase DeaD